MALTYFRLSSQTMIKAPLAEMIYGLKPPFFIKNTCLISPPHTVAYYTFLVFLNPF